MDEDDLKWVTNEKKILLLKQFREKFRSNTPSCRTLGDSSDMQNDGLMPREGLKGYTKIHLSDIG